MAAGAGEEEEAADGEDGRGEAKAGSEELNGEGAWLSLEEESSLESSEDIVGVIGADLRLVVVEDLDLKLELAREGRPRGRGGLNAVDALRFVGFVVVEGIVVQAAT